MSIACPEIALVTCMKNEARRLPEWLKTNQPLFDEIILVDNASNDDSVKIAQEGGVKAIEGGSVENFSALRNQGLDNVSLGIEWVIQLDLDEALGHPVAQIKLLLTDEAPDAFVGTVSNRGHAMRIFRNKPTIRYKGRVHETIRGYKTYGITNIIINHPPSSFNIWKAYKYWGLMMQDLKDAPDEPHFWFNIGQQLKCCGLFRDAIGCFEKAYSFEPNEMYKLCVKGIRLSQALQAREPSLFDFIVPQEDLAYVRKMMDVQLPGEYDEFLKKHL